LITQIISGKKFLIINITRFFNKGIIIDTFAVLREEEEGKKDDMENHCFICGLDRSVFKIHIFI
jgi:hypothetical protein